MPPQVNIMNLLESCPFLFGQSQNTRWPKNQLLDEASHFDCQDHRDSLGDQTAVSILVCRSILEMRTGLEHDRFEVLSKNEGYIDILIDIS